MFNEEKVREDISRCILETNRCISSWKEQGKFNRKALDHKDVRGLFINWFNRRLKDSFEAMTAMRVLRYNSPVVSTDKDTGMISNIYLQITSYYNPNGTLAEKINTILKSIDYKALNYNENDYLMDKTSQEVQHPMFIDLDAIRNFDFSNLIKTEEDV